MRVNLDRTPAVFVKTIARLVAGAGEGGGGGSAFEPHQRLQREFNLNFLHILYCSLHGVAPVYSSELVHRSLHGVAPAYSSELVYRSTLAERCYINVQL